MTVATFPRIKSVKAQPDKILLVEFDSGERKLYDCKPLLQSEPFLPLLDDAIFRCAHADAHGYGVVWTDEIDLAESEVWLNGQSAEPGG